MEYDTIIKFYFYALANKSINNRIYLIITEITHKCRQDLESTSPTIESTETSKSFAGCLRCFCAYFYLIIMNIVLGVTVIIPTAIVYGICRILKVFIKCLPCVPGSQKRSLKIVPINADNGEDDERNVRTQLYVDTTPSAHHAQESNDVVICVDTPTNEL
eukprot:3200_1